ncbi:MAG: hypothetical protein M1831_007559 [Alyxoria varia]|nr:MAG: hypothetical protein M1831_007559 [Alyxoria varia]
MTLTDQSTRSILAKLLLAIPSNLSSAQSQPFPEEPVSEEGYQPPILSLPPNSTEGDFNGTTWRGFFPEHNPERCTNIFDGYEEAVAPSDEPTPAAEDAHRARLSPRHPRNEDSTSQDENSLKHDAESQGTLGRHNVPWEPIWKPSGNHWAFLEILSRYLDPEENLTEKDFYRYYRAFSNHEGVQKAEFFRLYFNNATIEDVKNEGKADESKTPLDLSNQVLYMAISPLPMKHFDMQYLIHPREVYMAYLYELQKQQTKFGSDPRTPPSDSETKSFSLDPDDSDINYSPTKFDPDPDPPEINYPPTKFDPDPDPPEINYPPTKFDPDPDAPEINYSQTRYNPDPDPPENKWPRELRSGVEDLWPRLMKDKAEKLCDILQDPKLNSLQADARIAELKEQYLAWVMEYEWDLLHRGTDGLLQSTLHKKEFSMTSSEQLAVYKLLFAQYDRVRKCSRYIQAVLLEDWNNGTGFDVGRVGIVEWWAKSVRSLDTRMMREL